MLDKIYQALEKSTLDERIAGALEKDEDAKSKLKVFAGLVMNTEGTFADKQAFVQNYPNGYIDVEKLKTPNQVHGFSEWLMGDEFVKRVFDNLYTYAPQGIGPGEYALAVLSPEIKASGRSADSAGDLVILGEMCEVKAKQSSGGRFVDVRKAKMNQRAIEAAFKNLGIDPGRAVSAKKWTDSVRSEAQQADTAGFKDLVTTILEGAFAFLDKNQTQKLRAAIETGENNQIKHEWGLASFQNYKTMSKFETMLLLDGPKRHSLYFTDAEAVSGVLKAQQPLLYGPDQEVHPQMEFRI